jgi:tyrosine-protein phosphatase non-receptor type 23
LIAKVEEMRNQRAMLWTQFREAVHKDDITSVLVTRQADQPLEQLFQQELQKHQELVMLPVQLLTFD